MLQITKTQILQKWDNLPEALKEALFSDEIEAIILKTCQNHNLNDKQTEIVGIAIGDIFLGFLPPSHLAEELIKDGFSAELAALIYRDINEKILIPLKKELDQVYESAPPKTIPSSAKTGEAATSRETLTAAEPSPARLEFLRPAFQEQQPSPSPKTVHYSDLRTPIEPAFAEKTPFSSPASLASPETTPNPKINPSNLVDLKDIP